MVAGAHSHTRFGPQDSSVALMHSIKQGEYWTCEPKETPVRLFFGAEASLIVLGPHHRRRVLDHRELLLLADQVALGDRAAEAKQLLQLRARRLPASVG